MNKLLTKLSDGLFPELKNADEIWIAVALINSAGLKFIQDKLPTDCIQNYLIGINLPTEPKALWTLFEGQLKSDLKVRLYTDKETFHPKVYLFRKGNNYKGFIGSANCTNGGLYNNIELGVCVDDQETCVQIKNWFDKLTKDAKPVTKKFLLKYQEDYLARRDKRKEDERTAEREKRELNEEYETTLTERAAFIKVLKNYRRQQDDYKAVQKERRATVKELRSTLDYPNFKNIDVESFFFIQELGHIIHIPKPTIKKEIKKFGRLLKMICDEQTDIAVRMDRALNGDLKIRGVSEGLLSKVLVIHRPDLYFVKNEKSDTALKKYGIEFPRGLSKGDKYKITCKFLQQVCKETEIENLAVLDKYLYNEGKTE